MGKKDQDGLYKRGDSPYWWASFTDETGRRTRRSTGTSSRKEAEQILSKWRLEVRDVEVWGMEPVRTFEELMVAWLKENDRKTSAETDRQIVRRLWPHFEGVELNNLTATDISAYTQKRRDAGRADSSIRRELATLSAAINYARKHWEWDLPNPVTGRAPQPGPGRVRWVTREDAETLIAAARQSRSRLLGHFVELGFYTGMRSQEMLGLEWRRVDLHQRLLYLPPATNKSARHVSIPLNQRAYQVLLQLAAYRAEYCPDTPWVFWRANGERLQSVKKGFRAACEKAGIEDFTPHDLRHTCAAWLVQAGVSLYRVRDLLRHTSIQVTERYAHLAPDQVREAVAALDERHDPVTPPEGGAQSEMEEIS